MTEALATVRYVEDFKNHGFSFCGKAPVAVHYIRIGGLVLKLIFLEEKAIASVMPALQHLACDPSDDVSLTVTIGGRQTSAELLLQSPWREEIEACRDKILMVNADSFHMQYNPDSTIYSLIDMEAKKAFYFANHFDAVPYYEHSAPLKFILHWWCEHQGFCLVHAAAVGVRDAGVLLVGRGGSGKSTTAVSAAVHGLKYAGDDYVVLSHQSVPSALSIYCSGKINADVLAGLPVLQPHIVNPDRQATDKALVFLGNPFRSVWTGGIRLKAIVATKITGGKAALRKSSPTLVFAEIASSTIFQMPGSGARTLAALKLAFQALPVYTLELDTDFTENVRMLKDFCLDSGDER